MTDGYTAHILAGIAGRLAAADVGVWRPSGVYQDGETGIVLGAMPVSPDRVIVLTAYDVESDPRLADVVSAVQVRTRGGRHPNDVDALADAARAVLDGWEPGRLGDVPVSLIWWRSGAVLGTDANGRHERSDNYYLRAHRASTYKE